MERSTFSAFRVSKNEHGCVSAVEEHPLDSLPEGDLLVRVRYSSLNYKDALSASGAPGVTKQYPHTPGIDAFGEVAEAGGAFSEGDTVIVTGFDLGMNTWGGFGEFVRVPSDWAIPLPPALTLREAASLGTAGLTAGLAVAALLNGGADPEGGPVLVTGATGGVGTLALGILSRLGFDLQGMSGKTEAPAFLEPVAGTVKIIPREGSTEDSEKPLLKGYLQGAVDTVGGAPLASLLRSIRYGGTVAACGNAAGATVRTTVFPFILRAVTLAGIGSAQASMEMRRRIWNLLAYEWKPKNLDRTVREIGLDEVHTEIGDLLAGRHLGRTIITLP